VLSSPVHRNAPELHTDPAEQAYTMKELDKKLVFNALMVVVSVIIMVGVVSAIWFMEDTPVLALVEGIIISEIISTVIMIYLAYTSLQATISIRNLQKTLLDGKPINHNAPWKKNQRVKCSIAVIYVLIAISASVLPFIQLAKKETRTLPLVNNDLPIVRLADVEKNSKLVRKISLYNKEDIDWGNKYSYDWSLLAPIQYDSDEHGIISNEMWKDDSGEYSPSIHTNVYKLNFSFMTDNLIYDLIKKYNIENKDFLELDNTSLDKLIVQEEDGLKQIFASKGQSVMYIRYYGYADLDLVVKATEEKILLVSE
jgi:multisubunit Na+/H+ antiporter MnhB subunit